MVAMFLYYLLLVDRVVLRFLAYRSASLFFVLVCGRMLGEVGLFLLALAVATVFTTLATSDQRSFGGCGGADLRTTGPSGQVVIAITSAFTSSFPGTPKL